MKKALLIGLPLLLLLGGGGTVAASILGVVKVPFLPFGKKKAKPVTPPKDDGKGGPFAPTLALLASLEKEGEAKKAEKPKAPPPPAPDTGPGEKKLAGLWNELPPEKTAALVAKWPEPQLGRILSLMDEEAVTSLLAALPPERAASLSKTIAAATDARAQKVLPKT